MVCILARYRHGAREALRLERGDSSAGGAVIRRHDRVDLVVVRGQELFGVALGVGREPAIGVGLADILDLAGVDRFLQHFHLAREEEIRVGIGAVALDEDVVAFGLGLEHGARLHAADFLVVERQVEGVGVFDQAVVADHRNSLRDRFFDRRPDRARILRQDDERVGALRDQRLDIGELLACGRLSIR